MDSELIIVNGGTYACMIDKESTKFSGERGFKLVNTKVFPLIIFAVYSNIIVLNIMISTMVGLFPELQIFPNGEFYHQHKFYRFENSLLQNKDMEFHIFSSTIVHKTYN